MITMKRFRINRRGVSPIIATLLLVAIAVAASVITYTWAMSMTGNEANKSQTGIAIDKVMFGQAPGSSITAHSELFSASTTTSLVVPTGTSFAANDYIKITDGSNNFIGVSKVLSVSPATPDPAHDTLNLVITVPLPNAPASGTVERTFTNGVYASIRNTGSVAATIETVYLFKGDTLIFQKTGINYVIPVGESKGIAIAQTSYSYLTSGGQSLPSQNKLIDSTSTGGSASINFQENLSANTAYQLKVLTNNGFQTVGTYYSPGNFG